MDKSIYRYFIVNKPQGMVSQFISPHKVCLLADLKFDFPEGIHAVGRLDSKSEGLLLLTTNKKVTRLLFNAYIQHERVYLVQVNDILSAENLEHLSAGVTIRIKGDRHYKTSPCKVKIADEPGLIYPNASASEKYGPHTWLLITLTEGKFHQVRKMVNAVHHRCKRLIRVSIEDIELGELCPGEVKEMEEKEFFEKLKITSSSTPSPKTKMGLKTRFYRFFS